MTHYDGIEMTRSELLEAARLATAATADKLIADLSHAAACEWDCGGNGSTLEQAADKLCRQFPKYGCEPSAAMIDFAMASSSIDKWLENLT